MKFEFGDLYRFMVSLGVVLISISILAPWLFLKEPFDLFKTKAELEAITDVARGAILSRQQSIDWILRFMPWFSAIGTACGIGFIYLGLKRWRTNQVLLDEQTKLEVELKKQSLRDATKDEIAVAVAQDYEAMVAQEAPLEDYSFSSFQSGYIQLESHVAKRLAIVFGTKYQVECNKMVGGVEIDILLRGKTMLTKDVIIELRSIRKGFNYGWLRESFLRNVYAKNIYAQITNRMPNTLLLIVTDVDGETPDKYPSMLAKLSEEAQGRKGKDRVIMLAKQDFNTLSNEALQERLGIYA
jgi:hypothetical protein